jgi:hypothetical protein
MTPTSTFSLQVQRPVLARGGVAVPPADGSRHSSAPSWGGGVLESESAPGDPKAPGPQRYQETRTSGFLAKWSRYQAAVGEAQGAASFQPFCFTLSYPVSLIKILPPYPCIWRPYTLYSMAGQWSQSIRPENLDFLLFQSGYFVGSIRAATAQAFGCGSLVGRCEHWPYRRR